MTDVTFLPGRQRIEIPDGSSLLEAAKVAGIHIETPCGGHGLCKKWLVQIVSGAVDFENNGSLSDAQIADGYVLICTTKLKSTSLVVSVQDRGSELGQFADAGCDIERVDSSLLPKKDFSPIVSQTGIQVQEPASGDGLADADRVRRAIACQLGEEAYLPLGILRELPGRLREQHGRVTLSSANLGRGLQIVDLTPGPAADAFGLAVDIGTTTVAVQLVSLDSGRIVAADTEYNAQVACGFDVISRINYAGKAHHLAELQQKALQTINGLIRVLTERHDLDSRQICNISIAGNTTMIHLLLGILPEYIRLDPYTPAAYALPCYRAADIGLCIQPETPVYLAPAVGSYLGGDITSGLLCSPLAADSDEICLFIDIGTNGEIVLGNSGFHIGCACSAGPAFEGGGIEKGMRASLGAVERVEIDAATGLASLYTIGGAPPAGICGSGMISLIAGLFRQGWLDPAGKLNRERPCAAIRIEGRSSRYILDHQLSGGSEEIFVTESDISNLIRAKAAIFSACRVLLSKVELDFSHLSRIFIAGGFGRYLDIANAQTIGLIPALPREKYVFLGNAALSGAYMTLLSAKHREKQQALAQNLTYIDLGSEPEYTNEYTAALFLPHTDRNLFTHG